MANVLVAPLSWGLGHATRDIPIIRELIRRKHNVTIAASGRALALLKREFPKCNFIDFPDYPSPYTKSRFFVHDVIKTMPSIIKAMFRESKKMSEIAKENKFDLIVSDNRFTVFNQNIPSYFISHQLIFSMPMLMKPLERGSGFFNYSFYKYFNGVIIPDFSGKKNLSGKLSHLKKKRSNFYYAGILSSISKKKVREDIDYLFLISGPDPPRGELEKIILSQIHKIRGRKVVLLGKPEESSKRILKDGTIVLSHASRKECESLMNRAKFIITRSGYTTVMEVAELGKKALFIPTPGQTEQEYLSKYYEKNRFFHSVRQNKLNLERDIEIAKKFKGFPKTRSTKENARLLYNHFFKQHID